jgi:AraC family transcriptional regulator
MEEHLTDEIDYEQVAQIACCSSYHFQRMFHYLAEIPLSEYLRRRKMSLAAVDLQSGAKIIDVANKYGYSSPTAFNRAFQSIHGIAPSVAKQIGVQVKSFPPVNFKLILKGVEEMDYRIEKKEAFRIVGISTPLSKDTEKNIHIIPKRRQRAHADGTAEKIASLMDGKPKGLLGVSVCNEAEEWRYYIAVASSKNIDETLEEYNIPSYTWAIFTSDGIGRDIPMLERQILTEWLPSSGYEYNNGPDIEVYISHNPAKFEVWIPVRKKS